MPRLNKKIVCFGGGTTVPKLIMAELKRYPVRIIGVTSMVDNGGSTGQLRKDFCVLPPGDIRRHILALSSAPEWKKDLWKFRFGQEQFDGGHKGHNFANVFIAGLEYIFKDFKTALAIAHDFMEVRNHRALPATVEQTQLMAKLEDGTIIEGEDEIDVPKKHNPELAIKEVYLKPKVKAFPPTVREIEKADFITLGPGDLYSSLIPCFLPKGIRKSFRRSKAKKVLICNVMTKIGETNNFSVLDFVKEVEKYLGFSLDFVLYNTTLPDKKRIEEYRKEEPLILSLVKVNKGLKSKKFIGKDLLMEFGPIIHDPDKLSKALLNIIYAGPVRNFN